MEANTSKSKQKKLAKKTDRKKEKSQKLLTKQGNVKIAMFPRKKRSRRLYDDSEIVKAYELVKKKKSSIRKAAKLHGVPEATLRRYLKKGSSEVDVIGSKPLLPIDEEKLLKEHVVNMAGMGTVLKQSDIIKLATKTAIFLGLKSEKEMPLSKHWYRSFVRRWPELKGLRYSKNPAENAVREYYDSLNGIIEKYSLADKPHFMFYFDETCFHVECEPKYTSSSIEGGISISLEDSNLMVTVMSAGSAIGQYIPPYFICNGSSSVADFRQIALPGSCYHVTETGRSNGDLFLDFLENHLLKYSPARPEGQHILLFYPCQTACISMALSHHALTKGVVLFGLPQGQANPQPQSVSSFNELKNTYLTEFQAQMSENLMDLKERYQLCKLVSASYLHAFTPLNLISAFRETGLYPINRKKIQESYSVTESDQRSDAAVTNV